MPVKSDSDYENDGVVGTFSIVSPYSGESAEFSVMSGEVQSVHDIYFKTHNSNELVETIVFSCYENDELLKDERLYKLISEVQPSQASSLQQLVEHFNTLSHAYFERHGPCSVLDEGQESRSRRSGSEGQDVVRGTRATSFERVPGVPLRRLRHSRFLSHVVQMCYNRAVSEPNELNKQKPFSTQTYGETMFPFVEHMVKHMFFTRIVDPNAEIDADSNAVVVETDTEADAAHVDQFVGWKPKRISPDDRFVDLGSGVGQVVLQVAASVAYDRPVVGVEKATVPQRYAENMAHEFVRWMRFFARGYSPFVLIGDDFLDTVYADVVKRSTVVFANNFLFGPQVDLRLTQLFADLPEGARVVSSKRFCDESCKITERNKNDISAIMRVETFDALVGAVSWTSTAFSFYLQTIDRTRLESYYYNQRHPELNDDRDRLQQLVAPSNVESLRAVHLDSACNSSSNGSRASSVQASALSNSLSARRRLVHARRGSNKAQNVPAVTRLIADDESQSPATTSLGAASSDVEADTDELKASKRKRIDASASVLQLFHTQADSLATGAARQRTASGNIASAQYDPASVYPSSSFNLPEYNDFARERSEALRSTALPRLTSKSATSRHSAISSSTSSSGVTNQRPPSTTSTSRSGSTSGVFSAGRRTSALPLLPPAASKSTFVQMHDVMRHLTEQPASPSALLSLLRTQVDKQRELVASVKSKKALVARFVANQRARLHALFVEFSRLECAEARKRRSGTTSQSHAQLESDQEILGDAESGSKILLMYARRSRAAVDAERRRRELRTQIVAARRALDAKISDLHQSHARQTQTQSVNLKLNSSPPSSNMARASYSLSPVEGRQQPPVTLAVSGPYPQYAAQYLVPLTGPPMQPVQLGVDCVNGARVAFISPPGTVSRPTTASFFNLLPATSAQAQTHAANLGVSVYTPVYARPPNTL